MNVRPIFLGFLLVVGAADAHADSAADLITLRDGSAVKGQVVSAAASPRGSIEFLVRRAWAEKFVANHLKKWDHATAATRKQAVTQRQNRLKAWRRERAPSVGAEDRIIAWIDRELTRLGAPGDNDTSVLVKVRLTRTDLQKMDRRPGPVGRLLRLAWLCDLDEPESMAVDDLKTSLEARGYAVDALASKQPAALDRLLPMAPEPEMHWLGRRAATELAVDPDLRFLRFGDTVFPDAGAGQPLGAMGLTTAVSELKRLLDLDAGPKTDPLADKLRSIGARGRTGAVVTLLQIPPDMSGVTVESTLWVRDGQRWLIFGSRNATVRPDDLAQEAGKNLADDPQVKGAFQIAELLGLGAIPADVKDRSLRIGAATEKALGMARAAFNQDLDDLALPVLEPGGEARPPGPQPAPIPKKPGQ